MPGASPAPSIRRWSASPPPRSSSARSERPRSSAAGARGSLPTGCRCRTDRIYSRHHTTDHAPGCRMRSHSKLFSTRAFSLQLLLVALDVPAKQVEPVPAQSVAGSLAPPAVGREGMVLVPAGEFKIGSSEDDSWAERDEMPQRVVRLPAFLIDQLEVSNIEYKRFIDATGWPPPPAWKD